MNLRSKEIFPIRTALIGFGFSGAIFHSPFLKVLPAFQVTHVVSSQNEKVHTTFPSIDVLPRTSIETCLENPLIDLVIITAPNKDHYPLAKKALLHDKHVVVEKPFVLTQTEGRELIDIAQKQSKVLSVFHNRRWDSDFLTVKNIIHSGALGNISTFISRYDRYRPHPKLERWKESDEEGAGTLWDLGAHLIDQTLQLFGLPERLFAEVLCQRTQASAVDYFDIKLMYRSGMRANLSSSTLCIAPGSKYEVHGTEGSFVKCGHDPQELALIRGVIPTHENFGKESENFHGKITTQNDGTHTVASLNGCYLAFFQQLQSAILHGTQPPVTPQDALNVIKLIKLCEQSSKEQRVMTIE